MLPLWLCLWAALSSSWGQLATEEPWSPLMPGIASRPSHINPRLRPRPDPALATLAASRGSRTLQAPPAFPGCEKHAPRRLASSRIGPQQQLTPTPVGAGGYLALYPHLASHDPVQVVVMTPSAQFQAQVKHSSVVLRKCSAQGDVCVVEDERWLKERPQGTGAHPGPSHDNSNGHGNDNDHDHDHGNDHNPGHSGGANSAIDYAGSDPGSHPMIDLRGGFGNDRGTGQEVKGGGVKGGSMRGGSTKGRVKGGRGSPVYAEEEEASGGASGEDKPLLPAGEWTYIHTHFHENKVAIDVAERLEVMSTSELSEAEMAEAEWFISSSDGEGSGTPFLVEYPCSEYSLPPAHDPPATLTPPTHPPPPPDSPRIPVPTPAPHSGNSTGEQPTGFLGDGPLPAIIVALTVVAVLVVVLAAVAVSAYKKRRSAAITEDTPLSDTAQRQKTGADNPQMSQEAYSPKP